MRREGWSIKHEGIISLGFERVRSMSMMVVVGLPFLSCVYCAATAAVALSCTIFPVVSGDCKYDQEGLVRGREQVCVWALFPPLISSFYSHPPLHQGLFTTNPLMHALTVLSLYGSFKLLHHTFLSLLPLTHSVPHTTPQVMGGRGGNMTSKSESEREGRGAPYPDSARTPVESLSFCPLPRA